MKTLLWLAVIAAAAFGAYVLWKRGMFPLPAVPPLPEIPPGPGQELTPYELCVRAGQPPDLCRVGAAFTTTVLKAGADFAVNKVPVGNAVLTKALGVPKGTPVKVTCAKIGPVKLWGKGC